MSPKMNRTQGGIMTAQFEPTTAMTLPIPTPAAWRWRAAGLPTHIVDIAAGPGRYLLELLAAEDRGDLSAHCRDLDPEGQRQGRMLAGALRLNTVTFAPGDATDPADLSRVSPRPQIAI